MILRQKAGFLHADADLVERIGVYHALRFIYAQEKVQTQKVARNFKSFFYTSTFDFICTKKAMPA